MKLTQEIIEKAKAAESAEELLAIAKENGIDMTADEAKTYFEQLNANSLDDDLLEGVAGGWLIYNKDAIGPGKKGQC
jgi:predicted ribosomally synthesized peptide with nif11-like leader